MPFMCYSCPGDIPPGSMSRDASRAARRDLRRMPVAPCYGYPNSCFSYPDDVPRAAPGRGAVAQARPGLRQMPQMCFSY